MADKYYFPEPPQQWTLPLARPGYPLLLAAAFTTLVLALLALKYLALLGLLATFFIGYFFRDPDRAVPQDGDMLVSPADGKVIRTETVPKSPFGETPCTKISIFMSVFNVHVNRIPYDGNVEEIRYTPGRFVAADRDSASEKNERNAIKIRLKNDAVITVVQVAGLVARRIVSGVQPGDEVKKGQRFGMICFGSRLDVFMPETTQITVAVGDRVKAGSSVLGRLKNGVTAADETAAAPSS